MNWHSLLWQAYYYSMAYFSFLINPVCNLFIKTLITSHYWCLINKNILPKSNVKLTSRSKKIMISFRLKYFTFLETEDFRYVTSYQNFTKFGIFGFYRVLNNAMFRLLQLLYDNCSNLSIALFCGGTVIWLS